MLIPDKTKTKHYTMIISDKKKSDNSRSQATEIDSSSHMVILDVIVSG